LRGSRPRRFPLETTMTTMTTATKMKRVWEREMKLAVMSSASTMAVPTLHRAVTTMLHSRPNPTLMLLLLLALRQWQWWSVTLQSRAPLRRVTERCCHRSLRETVHRHPLRHPTDLASTPHLCTSCLMHAVPLYAWQRLQSVRSSAVVYDGQRLQSAQCRCIPVNVHAYVLFFSQWSARECHKKSRRRSYSHTVLVPTLPRSTAH
jgi:hypothetical protein